MMGDRQWPDPQGWEALTQAEAESEFGAGRGSDTKGAGARNTRPTSPRRILPLCTPDEIAEELADIDHDLDRLANVRPVTPDGERKQEREDSLRWWRARLLEQLAADGQPRCDACGATYLNKWAHAEECTGQ